MAIWPFKSKMVGHPVYINCGQQPAEFRQQRAQTRVDNLTAKLSRLNKRASGSWRFQEVANTKNAIQAWSNILELAELELSQQHRGIDQ